METKKLEYVFQFSYTNFSKFDQDYSLRRSIALSKKAGDF